MPYRLIYFIVFAVIVFFVVSYAMSINEKHDSEIKRINILEKKFKQKKFMVDQARLESNPCPIPDLNTPKDCYTESNYQCNWSIDADRCNLIEN
jgi:hypothetical protein